MSSDAAGFGCLQAQSRLAAVLLQLKHRSAEADALEKLQALPAAGQADVAQRLRAARAAARISAMPDHYQVLGVARDADADEVVSCPIPSESQGEDSTRKRCALRDSLATGTLTQ